MTSALFKPVPFEEAAEFLRNKPVVTRAIFDQMLPEVQALSFTITGVENFDVLQRARDRIAELPRGGDWNEIKNGLVEDMLPYMDPRAAIARAELLLRQHGFQVYRVQQWQQIQETKDVFPFLKYIATRDSRVRHSHNALHGLILPVDDPFWLEHMPPWEHGCRCQVIQVDQEDAEEAAAQEMHLPLDQHKVLIEDKHAAIRERLNTTGQLTTGPGEVVDVRSPRQRGGSFASLNDLRISLEALRDRYDPDIWAQFASWAEKTQLPGDARTVMAWLRGEPARRLLTQTQTVSTLGSFGALVSQLGISTTQATAEDMSQIMQELIKSDSAQRNTVITKIHGSNKGAGALKKKNIEAVADEFLSMVPREVAEALPPFEIKLTKNPRIGGDYRRGVLRLNINLANNPAEMRRTLFHEMTHWLHRYRQDAWPAAIKQHYISRTAAESMTRLAPYAARGKRDKWYDSYAGTIYGFSEESKHLGLEVPTRYVELLTLPANQLKDFWNHPDHGETLRIVLEGFFKQ